MERKLVGPIQVSERLAGPIPKAFKEGRERHVAEFGSKSRVRSELP